MNFPILPVPASEIAEQTDAIFFGLIGMSVFFLTIIFVPMIYCLFHYRRENKVDRTMPKLPHNAIEITWSVGPLILTLCAYFWGANVFFAERRPAKDAMEVNVVGKQWMWKMEHAEGNSEINELHVPVGRLVRLTMASQDVIHSFFLPEFRIKQDVVPGRYTTEWFKATRVGTFRIFCSQYCGVNHSLMVGHVIVMSQPDYAAWLSRGSPSGTLVQQGARLFRDLGCSGCHMGTSVVRAPRLEGLFGKPIPLQNGEVIVADETYIHDCILLPTLRVPGGYAPIMPSFQGHVTEGEVLELVAYIKSLSNVQPEKEMP